MKHLDKFQSPTVAPFIDIRSALGSLGRHGLREVILVFHPN